jgi:hypothetical protein
MICAAAMTIIDVVEVICIPMLIAGTVAAAYAERFSSPKTQRIVLSTGIALWFTATLISLYSFSESARMTANLEIAVAFLGLSLITIPLWHRTARFRLSVGKGRKAFIGIAILGSAFLIGGVWTFVGDFCMPRKFIYGELGSIRPETGGAPRVRITTYHLRLNGRNYFTTADVFRKTGVWKSARLEIGAGSGLVFDAVPIYQ